MFKQTVGTPTTVFCTLRIQSLFSTIISEYRLVRRICNTNITSGRGGTEYPNYTSLGPLTTRKSPDWSVDSLGTESLGLRIPTIVWKGKETSLCSRKDTTRHPFRREMRPPTVIEIERYDE